ncbi:hypothetical protein QQF64_025417 [Cirrhinus molitorella]|uniref:Uncharacterized protein n=1 Tax=Cirrhinus molitorella TaxID=172907 RepID=A0ABR3NNZ3_9TELE
MRSRRHRLSDKAGRAGRRWGQKRETKRDEAPEASCYATADLLTYISKQKQLAAGYWSASPTQHKEPGQKHTGCGIHAYRTQCAVCVDHFAFLIQVTEADTKRLVIVVGRQKYILDTDTNAFHRAASWRLWEQQHPSPRG